jgi:hypothetical protein
MKLNYKYRKSVTSRFYIIPSSFIVPAFAYILHMALMSEYRLHQPATYANAGIPIYFPADNGMTEPFRDISTL